MTSISRIVVLLFGIFALTACGSSSSGGGDGGTGGSGPITLSQLADNFAQHLASLEGDEAMIDPANAGAYTIEFVGFAWCLPANVHADPAMTATPPNNLYGCQNGVAASAIMGAEVEFTITMPDVFYDAAVQGGADVYMQSTVTSTTVSVSIAFIDNGDSTFNLNAGATPTVMTNPGTVSAGSDDAVTNAALGSVAAMDMENMYAGVMETIMADEIQAFAATADSFTMP